MTVLARPDYLLRDFRVRATDAQLEDLTRRLAATRWPEPVSDESDGFRLGTSRPWLEALVAYWRDGLDWRAQEDWLATKLPSQLARIRGIDIHFSCIRGEASGSGGGEAGSTAAVSANSAAHPTAQAGPKTGPSAAAPVGRPLPLLLLHGWPSSYVEMHRIVEPLTRPSVHGSSSAEAFDVVVASIPGHGFSGIPRNPCFGADEAADLLCDLMVEVLGYDKFGVHGGDRGAFVAAGLGHRHPEHVAGIHLSLPLGIAAPIEVRSAAETAWLESSARWQAEEGGYSAIQSTRPRSLAYGLTDSPVGLAAWILEKFCAWSDCGGDPLNVFDRDELLTNVMIYWLSGSIGSSMQYYHAHRVAPPSAMRPVRIEVPTGVLLCAKETWRPPRSAALRKFPVTRWTELDRGGHFAALEVPGVVVEELRAFFRPLRSA